VKTARWPIIALLAVLVAGCSQPPVPQDHFYRLEVAPPAAALASPRLPGILEVQRFSADGLMAGRPIVFSEANDPTEVSAYYYHFWLEPPGVMLRDHLVAYLRAAGVAGTVVTPELRLEPDFVLTAKIRRIEQVRGASPKVVVALDVAIRSRKDDRLVMLKTYEVEKATANDGVTAAVEALGGVLATIYGRLVADIPAN
jgi:cholesterol transport system auxiliary component